METTVLYSGVSNLMSRNSLSKMLIAIVAATTDTAKAATQPPTNFETLAVEKVEKLVKADASLIALGPKSADGKTQAVQATPAGIAAVQSMQPIVAAPKPIHPTGGFQIETEMVELPAAKRGGDRSNLYPFDQLTVYPAPGSSFFVPNTESMPNAGKTIASTVSSATRRHKSSTPPRVFTIRADASEFPNRADKGRVGARVWRIALETATPAQASGADASATVLTPATGTGFAAPTA